MAQSVICSICNYPIDIHHSDLSIVRFMCGHFTHSECFYAFNESNEKTCKTCGLISSSIFFI